MSNIFNKQERFSIRKFNVGVASVLLGASLVAVAPNVKADEVVADEPTIVLEAAVESPVEEQVASEVVAEPVEVATVVNETPQVEDAVVKEDTATEQATEVVEEIKAPVATREAVVPEEKTEAVVEQASVSNARTTKATTRQATSKKATTATRTRTTTATRTKAKVVEISDLSALFSGDESTDYTALKIDAPNKKTSTDQTAVLTDDQALEFKIQEILEKVHSGEIQPQEYWDVDEDTFTQLYAKENIPSSGTYRFKKSSGVKNEPKISSPDLATYAANQTVNYDRVLEADGYQWISYISYSGVRRYVAINALATASTASNNNSTTPKTTTTVRVNSTGINISVETNQVKDKSKIMYAVWSDVNGQDDLKWYTADKNGKYVVNYNDHKGTGRYHVHTYSIETGSMVGLNATTVNVTQSTINSFNKRNQAATPETSTPAQNIPSSGTFHFGARAGIKAEPKLSSADLAYYDKGMSVNYDSVLNAEGKQWISYLSYDGNRRYIAVGNATSTSTQTGGQTTTKPATQPATNASTSGKINSNVTAKVTSNGYSAPWCTWGAKEAAPWASNSWGHANQWADNASRDGYTVGTTPSAGAIIVWQHGTTSGNGYLYGHVGVVKSINADGTLIIHESNFNGKAYVDNHRGNYRYTGYENGGWVKFIYPPKGY